MRHQKAGKKLNRTGSHRDAMFRNMVTSLFTYGKIRTTDTKAKELRRWADRIITLAKRGDLHARRQAMGIVRSKTVVHKLFEEAAERFGPRAGGYTRIIKIGQRAGDAAPVSLVEFITVEEKTERKKKKPKAGKKAAAAPRKASAPKAKKKAREKADVPVEEQPVEEAKGQEEPAAAAEEKKAAADKADSIPGASPGGDVEKGPGEEKEP